MAILNFQKPDKIILQKATDFEAQFEFRPLEPGYGVTIGNALRRVLLSSLEGYATRKTSRLRRGEEESIDVFMAYDGLVGRHLRETELNGCIEILVG